MILSKQASRELFLNKRNTLSPADITRLSEGIAGNLQEFLTLRPANWLHSFIGDSTRQEVDTVRIRELIQEELPNLRWVTPRMVPGTRLLEHYVWDDATFLITNRWGIQEPDPATAQRIMPDLLDIIFVPLLAYDCRGNRVGYGGGYYDRFLAECRPEALKVGLSFFDPLEQISGTEDWDVRLDYCITPGTIYGLMS